MAIYRIRSNGKLLTDYGVKSEFSNVSVPKVLTQEVCESLGIDPVLASERPIPGPYQTIVSDGAVQNENGDWVQSWSYIDMFEDFHDEAGTLHTKAEQEAAYDISIEESIKSKVRAVRDTLIANTDYLALSDNTLTAEMAAYRQALRDITSQDGFPHEITWPVKP